MRNNETTTNLLGGLLLVVLFGCAFLALSALASFGCSVRWGEKSEYRLLGGCFVKTSQGFVPEDRFRVVE